MDICLVTPELPPYRYGGIGLYVRDLAQGLAARGHRVTVIGQAIHEKGRLRHEWGESISIKWEWPLLWRYSDEIDPFGTLRAAFGLRFLLKRLRSRFDVVEVANFAGHGCFLPRMAGALVTRISTPYLDAIDRQTLWADRVVHWAERRTCLRSRMVITHSSHMAKKVVHRYEMPEPNRIIPLGIPDVPFVSTPSDESIDLLYIGRAEYRKGTDLLLRALATLLPRMPSMTATLIGTDIDQYAAPSPDLQKTVRTLRDLGRRRFCERGRVSDEEKLSALNAADWLVVPSRFESFGLVALEAMRAGTPVMVTQGTSLEDIGRMAPGTLCFNPADDAGLVRALEAAVSLGPRYKSRYRDAIRSVFLDRFTIDRMVAETELAYADVIHGGRSVISQAAAPGRSTLGGRVMK